MVFLLRHDLKEGDVIRDDLFHDASKDLSIVLEDFFVSPLPYEPYSNHRNGTQVRS